MEEKKVNKIVEEKKLKKIRLLNKIRESKYFYDNVARINVHPSFIKNVDMAQEILNKTKFEAYLKPDLGTKCDFILTTKSLHARIERRQANEIISGFLNEEIEQSKDLVEKYLLQNFLKMFQKQVNMDFDKEIISLQDSVKLKESLPIFTDALTNKFDGYIVKFTRTLDKDEYPERIRKFIELHDKKNKKTVKSNENTKEM